VRTSWVFRLELIWADNAAIFIAPLAKPAGSDNSPSRGVRKHNLSQLWALLAHGSAFYSRFCFMQHVNTVHSVPKFAGSLQREKIAKARVTFNKLI
jgi:hypothetical protein